MAEKYTWLAYSMIVVIPCVFLMSVPTKAFFTPSSKMPSFSNDWSSAVLSTFAFFLGAISSIIAGRLAMRIGGLANAGVTMKAYRSVTEAFTMAVRGGMVMGFVLITMGILNLFAITGISYLVYQSCDYYNDCKLSEMYGAVAGYGLGASFVALFSRVGGGIYTKAADVASDLVDVINYKTVQEVSKELLEQGNVHGVGSEFKDYANRLEIATKMLLAQEKVHEIQELRRRQHPDIQSDIDVAEQHIMDLCHEIELLKQQETVRDSTAFLADPDIKDEIEASAQDLKAKLEADDSVKNWSPSEVKRKYRDIQIDLDNKKHPSGIADLVGDNVCDIGGMGADLFASFVEGTIAAMVILSCASNCVYWNPDSATGMEAMASNFSAMMFPLAISATGLAACFAAMLLSTSCKIGNREDDPKEEEFRLITKCVGRMKAMLLASAGFMTPCFFILGNCLLPSSFWVAARLGHLNSDNGNAGPNKAVCEKFVWNTGAGTAIAFGHMTSLTEKIFDGTDSSSRCLGMPGTTSQEVHWWGPPLCASVGVWAAILVGYTAEHYTSNKSSSVREVAEATSLGDAVTLLYGLALGYQSVVPFMWIIAFTVFISWSVAQMFGIASAALGMLSIVVTWITLSGFAPIVHNAAGITKMCNMMNTERSEVFYRVQALNSAGDTITAMGKGYSVVSAAMVALALFGGFCARADVRQANVSLLEPTVFLGLFIGAMIPFYFSAIVLRSIVDAAEGMVKIVKTDVTLELKTQLSGQDVENKAENASLANLFTDENQVITRRTTYIQTGAHDSFKELVWFNNQLGCTGVSPLMLVVGTPILTGVLFGKLAMGGVVMGTIVTGVTMALAACNSGHAWDNIHTYVQQGYFEHRDDGLNVNQGMDSLSLGRTDDTTNKRLKDELQRDTEAHDAARVGNTVGDPLKDAAGPGINIAMKLVAMVALCVAPMVSNIRMGYGAIGCSINRNCAA